MQKIDSMCFLVGCSLLGAVFGVLAGWIGQLMGML